jgi:YYY domain-containing protein
LGFLALPVADALGIRYASKAVSLVLLTYTVWLFANIMEFKIAVLLGFVIYASTCSILLFRMMSRIKAMIKEFVRTEIIFTIFFLLYVLYTAFNPDLFSGEKMMDISVLNGVLRSDRMPPIDVNLAGFRFDCYYYMGYVIVATLTVLSQTPPTIAYNLGLATFFALVLTLLVEFALRHKLKFLPFLLLSGNLASFMIVLNFAGGCVGLINEKVEIAKAVDFWTVTRVIPGTINEFPFATLTFRDLHPHLMSIPFQILFLILLYRYMKGQNGRIVAFLSFLLGFMFTVNAWEFPTYLALLTLAIVFRREFKLLLWILLALVPFVPYHLYLNTSAVKGVGIVASRTSLVDFVVAQPLILIPFAWSFVRNWKVAIPAFIVAVPLALAMNFQTLVVLLPIVAVGLLSIRQRSDTLMDTLMVLSSLILLAVEVFYLDDAYMKEIERLNTVFKTHVQAWILLSFASALILANVRDRRAIAIVMVFLAILWIYPVGFLATIHDFKGTIDGMEFTKQYGEYDALRFLQSVENGVVLEYPGEPFESYTYAGRVSAFTGLQSVVCRSGHELFWRYFNNSTVPMLYERWKDATRIYSAKNLSDVMYLIEKYDIRYIYVGYLEKLHYGESLRKFEKFKAVYRDDNVVVYRIDLCLSR